MLEHAPDMRPEGAMMLQAAMFGAWQQVVYMVEMARADGYKAAVITGNMGGATEFNAVLIEKEQPPCDPLK